MMQNNFINNISAAEYAKISVLAQQVSEQMLSRLDLVAFQPKKIVDIGSATGHTVRSLLQRYPQAAVIGVGVAQPMLRYAKKTVRGAHWIGALADSLPFRDHTIDLLVTNLLLPWCSKSLEFYLKEWRRVLTPEGLLIVTSLGPSTLAEIKPAILSSLTLMDMHNLGDAFLGQGFSGPVLDIDYYQLRYQNLSQMVHELYITGFIHSEGHFTLETPSLALNYEVIFAHAWAPLPMAKEIGTAKFPLEQLRLQMRSLKAPLDDEAS